MKRTIQITSVLLLLIATLVIMSGCETISYYSQSIAGHNRLMMAREPVDEVLLKADDELKGRLLTAMEIRQYAIQDLSLPDNKSYTTYVQLNQNPIVWNVIAAEEFSLSAKKWCYLVVGCASYRGYFAREDADKYAEKMKSQGYDVVVVGATAYSTLGWFADPLTSAMFDRDDASLADLIFHELAHQKLYIKGNSRFNEAFASTVGEQGALRWLEVTNRQELLDAYLTRQSVRDDFLSIINQAKIDLNFLYSQKIPDEEKREKKQDIFNRMKASHQEFQKTKWNNKAWYKRWFSQPINNARLAAIGTYRDLVPGFIALFERCEMDFKRFYHEAEKRSVLKPVNLEGACE